MTFREELLLRDIRIALRSANSVLEEGSEFSLQELRTAATQALQAATAINQLMGMLSAREDFRKQIEACSVPTPGLSIRKDSYGKLPPDVKEDRRKG